MNSGFNLLLLTLACLLARSLAHLLSSRQLKQFIWKWMQTLYRIEFRYVNCILSCIQYVGINRSEMSRLHISYESNGTNYCIQKSKFHFPKMCTNKVEFHFKWYFSVRIVHIYTIPSYANVCAIVHLHTEHFILGIISECIIFQVHISIYLPCTLYVRSIEL